MLGHLIRKEILTHLTDLRFLILAGLGAALIWLGLYCGSADYLERVSDYGHARTLTVTTKISIAASSM